jgi:hypothetical protein
MFASGAIDFELATETAPSHALAVIKSISAAPIMEVGFLSMPRVTSVAVPMFQLSGRI